MPRSASSPVFGFDDDEDHERLFDTMRAPGDGAVGSGRLTFDGADPATVSHAPSPGCLESRWQVDDALYAQVPLGSDDVDVDVTLSTSSHLQDLVWLDQGSV